MRDAMVALGRRGIESAALIHQHFLSLKTSDETFTDDGLSFRLIRTGLWARLLFTPISPAFPWKMQRLIKTFKPDILHLHLPNPSAFWVLFLPSARRLPWVVHWHADVITSAQDWRMKLFYSLYRPFEQAVLKRANVIIVTSPPYRDSSKPLGKWLSKCQVLPLGVNTKRFNSKSNDPVGGAPCGDPLHTVQKYRREARLPRSEHSFPSPLLQILAVGRLTYYKGFNYLIEAAAQAPDVHINLVGDGDQAAHLKALVASLKLQDRVTFHGILSDTDLVQQMSDCDCLCLPSIERTEAFGMVLLEAMYFGKATIVSDVEGSGMGWVVDDTITGIKVKPADATALAGAFNRLAADREESTRMGQRGKEKFDQQFEINLAVECLVDIYQQVTNQSD